MANLYVATAFGNRAEAKELMERLRTEGHTISHDWTGENVNPAWSLGIQSQYLQACGAADFRGVVEADAVILINHPECRDAMTEFGIALGRGIPVFVLHPDVKLSVFFHRAAAIGDVVDLFMWLENGCRNA